MGKNQVLIPAFSRNFKAAKRPGMKKIVLLVFGLLACVAPVLAQCSLCTKTAQQLGEGPAKGLNNGILMLAITPLAIIGLLGYRFWKSTRDEE